jgi:hypothetical protein
MGRFLASLLSDLCAAEIAAWLPWIALKITRVAVRTLPEAQRERYDEEWRGHLSEIPGALTKLGIACGFLCAAIKIRPRRTRVPEIAFYYWLLVPLAAMRLLAMCAMSAVWALRAPRWYAVPLELDLGNRDVPITIDRIPLGLALRLALSPRVSLESLNRSPYHYSIWSPSRSAGLEDFISTRVLRWYPHLRFGMKMDPLPLHWLNIRIP